MNTAPTPGYAGFARLYWMFVGPMLCALVAYQLVRQGGGWLTTTSVALLLLVAALPIARRLEFSGGRPQTAEGEPAAPGDLRRYAVGVSIVGIVVWVVANAVGDALSE